MKLNIKVLPFSAEQKMARKFAQNLISILDSKDSKVLRIRIKKTSFVIHRSNFYKKQKKKARLPATKKNQYVNGP